MIPVFFKIFSAIGMCLDNHTAYKLARAEYIDRGYSSKQAHYAALGMLSWYFQHGLCKYYEFQDQIFFERTK